MRNTGANESRQDGKNAARIKEPFVSPFNYSLLFIIKENIQGQKVV